MRELHDEDLGFGNNLRERVEYSDARDFVEDPSENEDK